MFVIKGGLVYTDRFIFEPLNIVIEDDCIACLLADDQFAAFLQKYQDQGTDIRILSADGFRVIPGLVDIHLHGADGYDFCKADLQQINQIAQYEASVGVLNICPSTMSLPIDELGRICSTIAEYRNWAASTDICNKITYATICGINLEGPYLAPNMAGAQNIAHLRCPDLNEYVFLQNKSQGLIRLVDIAPELDGATAFIQGVHELSDGRVNVSIGHTQADMDICIQAFAAGANHCTHLYNAMPQIDKRDPGPIVAAYENRAYVELIADGVHVSPSIVRLTFDLFGDDRVVLISDSMEATGLGDGQFMLGDQNVTVRGSKAVLTNDESTIAGSITNLYECLRTAVIDMHVPMEKAIRAATYNPAASVGIENDIGIIQAGRTADIVIINENLDINMVIKRGNIVFDYMNQD